MAGTESLNRGLAENPKAREISQSFLIGDRFSPTEKNYDFAVA
jgi:hypothetical protein